jgi:hypothetical protein
MDAGTVARPCWSVILSENRKTTPDQVRGRLFGIML